MNDQAERVYGFVATVVGALRALGVVDFVVSPGSRSTPLALSLAKAVSGDRLHVVVDERAAAFVALGLSRVTGVPTVLVCTSGSAVAHKTVVDLHCIRTMDGTSTVISRSSAITVGRWDTSNKTAPTIRRLYPATCVLELTTNPVRDILQL